MQKRTPTLDAQVRAAWQTQLAAAAKTPGLLPELIRHRSELLPRFAAYYSQLHALPRPMRRALQRQWKQSLAGLALLLALGQSPVQAAMITVGGACTLVDAIVAANTDTATGGCLAGSGADTIVLPTGSTQTLTEVNNSTYGATGLPVISSEITIVGQRSKIARASEAPEFRLLAVSGTGELTLQETTVSGGIVPDGYSGNGVANFGTLTLLNSTLSGNSISCSGFYCSGYNGGGMANFGTCTVLNSTISGNVALDSGGGVANGGGTLTLLNSTISGNIAGDGGGVANSGTLTLLESTLSGNVARHNGGGVANSGTLTVLNSTLSDNIADYGGGVENYGTLTLARTLVAGNTAPRTGPEINNNIYSGTVLADNYNLFGVDGNAGVVGFSPGPTDVVPPAGVELPDILNPTLANNGGPTKTHALVPGSLAIDAAGPVCTDAEGEPLTTDQRGRPRPVDGDGDGIAVCDIGAFERGRWRPHPRP